MPENLVVKYSGYAGRGFMRRESKFCLYCGSVLKSSHIDDRIILACASQPECDFVDWNNPVPSVNVLVALEGKILLVRRAFDPKAGDWCLPCGYMDSFETPEQAASRELFEESGLIVSPGDMELIGVRDRADENSIQLYYLANAYPDGKLTCSKETVEVEMFDETNIPFNIAFDDHRKLIFNWLNAKLVGFNTQKVNINNLVNMPLQRHRM